MRNLVEFPYNVQELAGLDSEVRQTVLADTTLWTVGSEADLAEISDDAVRAEIAKAVAEREGK